MRHRWWAVGCLVLWQTVAAAQTSRPPQTPPAQPTGRPTQGTPVQLGAPQGAAPAPATGQPGTGQPIATTPAQPATGQPATGQPTNNQPTPPAQPLDPQNNPLDRYLLQWEKEMMGVESLVAPNMSRTEVNMTFQQTEVYQGSAKYLKPNFAMLEMQRKSKPEEFEKFVCSGQYLYQYLPAQKEIRAHPLPPPKAGQGVADDNFLSFLFGMKAEEAKRRYDLKLAKEDQFYVYIDVTPRFDQDKADFQRARLVLNKTNFMPRQLWFEQPNKDTVTWDIPTVDTKAPLKKDEFTKPATPPGWTIKEMPRNDLKSPEGPVIRGGKP